MALTSQKTRKRVCHIKGAKKVKANDELYKFIERYAESISLAEFGKDTRRSVTRSFRNLLMKARKMRIQIKAKSVGPHLDQQPWTLRRKVTESFIKKR